MNSQSVVTSHEDRTKEVTRLGYYHPGIDPVIDRLFPDPADNQSVRYILDAIVWKQRLKILEKHRAEENGTETDYEDVYCWFNHEFYLRLLGPDKYSSRMKLLVENRVLKESFFTSKFARHPIYQLFNPEHLKGYTLKPITIPRVLKKIANYQKWRLRPPDVRITEHILRHFWRIDLDEAEFRELWLIRYRERYLSSKRNPLSFDDYMRCGDQCWCIIDRWNKASVEDKMLWFHSCKFGNRLHHPFTYLPSDVRAYIVDREGRPVRFTEYDLGNSQPAFFANTMVERNPVLRDTGIVRLIEKCRIYEDLANKLKITREVAKVEFLHFLFCMTTSNAQKQFEMLYGLPAIIAGKMKSQEHDADGNYLPFDKRHKELPKAMQRMESKMFREIWEELLIRGFVFLPVHDAVYVSGLNRQKKKEVLNLMKSIMKKHMKIKFKIKMKVISRY